MTDRRLSTLSGETLTAAWAARDLGGAGEFVTGLPDGAARREATISVVSVWSAKDPTAAAAWVEQLRPGSLRDYAIENVMFHWARSMRPRRRRGGSA